MATRYVPARQYMAGYLELCEHYVSNLDGQRTQIYRWECLAGHRVEERFTDEQSTRYEAPRPCPECAAQQRT